MFAHPVSEYFSVGKIGEDQLEDYARRRRRSIEEMRKQEVDGLIRQRRITNGRTDALIFLD